MQDSVQSSLILKTTFISLFYDHQDISPCWVCALPKMCVPTVHHLTWHPCSTLPCWGECQCGHQGFPSPSRRTCGSPWWRGEPFSWNHCRETRPLMIQNATTPMLTIILQSIKQHWTLVAWAFCFSTQGFRLMWNTVNDTNYASSTASNILALKPLRNTIIIPT